MDFKEFMADTKSAVLLFSLVCNTCKENKINRKSTFKAQLTISQIKVKEERSAILATSTHFTSTPCWLKLNGSSTNAQC